MKITTTLLYYDVENGNGRIYTKKCAKDIVNQFKKMKKDGAILGEPSFPDGRYGDRSTTFLGNVSHEIEEIHLDEENKCIVGNIKILDSDPGKILKELYKSPEEFNNSFSVRSRGIGDVDPSTKEVINYQIVSFDLVPKEQDSFKEIEQNLKLKL
jgi:hypothetical protein